LKGYVYINNDIQNGIASTGFAQIRVKEPNILLSKYVYYIITTNYITDELISKAKGAQYPAVSFNDFENLKIPIPSLEKQKELIDYCENNNNLIKQLEKEIEQNKIIAKEFISNIMKKLVTNNEFSEKDSEINL
jgi:type I restriction enzyme S subunit